MQDLYSHLRTQAYAGRGIILGVTPSGRAALAYFIMGRSASSRARRFFREGDDLIIKSIADGDPEHPELIIYAPLRVLGNRIIVTNGDQTDTVYDGLRLGGSFESALRTRCFEPDPPHYTSRISGLIALEKELRYTLSILKAGDAEGRTCVRQFFDYEAEPGAGHYIHTYSGTAHTEYGDVLLPFAGEPLKVMIPDDIGEFTDTVWNGINEDNKVALYVRITDRSGRYEDRLVNKY